jgi:hypothetical protein
MLFTPFGATVPEPTLQSHVRNAPFRFFPLELSLRNVPGYERINLGDLRFVGRKEVFLPRGDESWVRGASRVEVHMLALAPIEGASFLVRNLAPRNRIEIAMGEARETLEFEKGEETRRIDLAPGRPDLVRSQEGTPVYVYRLIVTPETGRNRPWTREYAPSSCPYFSQNASTEENFFVGAALSYLGSGANLDADVYAVQWGNTVVPPTVRAGETFTILTRLFNRSRHPWTAEGAARVHLSYHWLDEGGKVVVRDGVRSFLELPVPPGGRVSAEQKIEAPKAPGRYILELDPVFENVAWFSEKNGGKTWRAPVEVMP